MSSGKTEVKIVVCGDTGVGKTRLIARWMKPKDAFFSAGLTVGADFKIHSGKEYKYKIWDLAGQATYRNMLPMYQRGKEIALFVFDVSNEKGLENLESVINEAKEHLDTKTSLILVGNKRDLGVRVSTSAINKFKQSHGIKKHLIVSAQTGYALNEFDDFILHAIPGFSLQKLAARIAILKTLYKENPERSGAKNLLNIVKILEKGIKADSPQQYFNDKLPALKKNLDALRWTWRSVLNTVVDVILTVFAVLSIVGLPLLYCLGVWEPNGHYNGVLSSFRFCTFGDKQKMQQLCEDVFEETDVKRCQFGQ